MFRPIFSFLLILKVDISPPPCWRKLSLSGLRSYSWRELGVTLIDVGPMDGAQAVRYQRRLSLHTGNIIAGVSVLPSSPPPGASRYCQQGALNRNAWNGKYQRPSRSFVAFSVNFLSECYSNLRAPKAICWVYWCDVWLMLCLSA